MNKEENHRKNLNDTLLNDKDIHQKNLYVSIITSNVKINSKIL